MSAHTGANPKKEMTKKKLNLIGLALEDKTLTPSSKVVLTQLLLKHHNDETAQCNPSQRTLAHALALSQSQVKRAVRQLKEC